MMTTSAIPAELLARPTIGAVRRARGITGPSPYARHALAVALIEEAQRRAILGRLDGVLIALHRGARPAHVAARLERLVADLRAACAGVEHREAA